VVSGIQGAKVVVIVRHSGFRLDAGKVVTRLFGKLGSAGGHRHAARVEIPVTVFRDKVGDLSRVADFIREKMQQR
jgi:nanoRNase/pAp phosphatase (c-di-AMP/oligoRNAs hydrolase)